MKKQCIVRTFPANYTNPTAKLREALIKAGLWCFQLLLSAATEKRERNIFWKGRKIDVAEISVKFSEYRACVVKGKNALFHRWADKAQTVGESPLRGGHSSGQVWLVVGIIEYEDGTVHEAYPYEIRFLDGKLNEYCFDEPRREEREEAYVK